ncbi:MAG: DUF308 domain-containing protein [Aestuariivirga sp.]|uniref:HdeD family acid-resistance protein n=1 Tax=Aestuariivirga sp. TaxID=2650926 RepID=UPI0025BCDD6F|nr:DUF308 domain-containing protein [Aestuariivirga sp.]MCA3561257.1 DUF308 domain-containing protein [Aestuariivirga sp.]
MAMREFFTAMWRTILLRGLASLAFGIVAFVYPQVTLAVVVTLFGIYALADGLLGLWGAFRGKEEGSSMTGLLTAIAGVVAGLVCLLAPDFATRYVVLLIGLWNIAAGLLQLIGALVLWKDIEQPGYLAVAGVIGAALGGLIMFYPTAAAVSVIWVIAGTAVLVGLVLLAFGWKLRAAAQELLKARGV